MNLYISFNKIETKLESYTFLKSNQKEVFCHKDN